jgi:hypothetical protein
MTMLRRPGPNGADPEKFDPAKNAGFRRRNPCPGVNCDRRLRLSAESLPTAFGNLLGSLYPARRQFLCNGEKSGAICNNP